MQVQEENAPFDDINVTPMLDLAYVLLVIFIIMTTASVQGVKVDVPRAKMSAGLAKSHLKAITVSATGDVYLDAYPVTMEQLETRLLQLKAVNPSQPMVIKGDARAQYLKVMQVLEVLKKVDITDIGLVTGRVS
ncbi:MAG: biopolymer transporter ExbD [Microbacteriaceae bacterium]|nr:biopolymer transporter ExbD [Burkholderiaceae bacterium]